MEKKSGCISRGEHNDSSSGWIAMLVLMIVAIAAALVLLAM